MLDGFINLQRLTVRCCNLTKKLMQSILILPRLQILILQGISYDENDANIFDMKQYTICFALKEFHLGISTIKFTEKMLCSILTCFASPLERLETGSVDMSQEIFHALQEEYRFKTIITSN